MNGGVRIRTQRGPRGETRLAELHASAPLAAKLAAGALHLIGTAAAPLDGDEVTIELELAPGTQLTVRTVAATMAWPSRHQGRPSVMRINARVGAGALLRWLPEPVVPVLGCHHIMRTHVELDPAARCVWREEFILGRLGEAPGTLATHTRVLRGGAPLLHQELLIDGGGASAHRSPALLGGARATGGLLVVGPGAAAAGETSWADAELRGAVLELEGGGRLASATSSSAPALRRWLEQRETALTGGSSWDDAPRDAAPPAAEPELMLR